MPNKNHKTHTDTVFENYLLQREISFIFEPEPVRHKTTIPDYSFSKDGKNTVVECEEVLHLPNDNLKEGVTSLDLNQMLEPLKRKLYIASKQIKPYSEKYDYSIIILGKKEGWSIDLREVYWAMFGNPVFRIPIDPTGKKRFKAIPDMQVKGQFRKNDPLTKQMIFPGKYVSGVAIVRIKNGLEHYKSKLYDKYVDSKDEGTDLDKSLEQTINFFNNGWEKYKHEIPNIYLKDNDRLIYYVEAISNPFSQKPLPRNIFNGRFDRTIMPKVIER